MSKAILVAGLGFGDEGKGTITQYLAHDRNATLVVRYNGGPQAAHNVYGKDGEWHTFTQFGSATLEGVPTHLSKYMLVEPHALLKEGRDLVRLGIPDPYTLLTIDREALLVTPYHWSANRLRELLRGAAKHGTCGAGVGEAMSDFLSHGIEYAPIMADLEDPVALKRKLSFIQEGKMDEFRREIIDDLPDAAQRALRRLSDPVNTVVESYAGYGSVLNLVSGDTFLGNAMSDRTTVFEGAQGVLLDQDFGFHPHTTWTDTTFGNAQQLLGEAGFGGEVEKVGVLRTYMTRHGVGPLPTEEATEHVLDKHNSLGLWQGPLRAGPFDFMLAHYALKVIGGVDSLAVTHLDQLRAFDTMCAAYKVRPEQADYYMTIGDSTDGGRKIATQIELKKPSNLQHQYELGESLRDIKPMTIPRPEFADEFLAEVALGLKTPVKIISTGPGFFDKNSL